ncbi:MAG: 30S ribosomal protein S16 [Bacteroidota bacterium]
MAVRIRLARHGRKKKPIYYVVVADSRSPRDGRFIEKLGTFNPNVNPPEISIDAERAFYWAMTGAQPSGAVRSILSNEGVLLRKHLQIGVNKGAITQEDADKRFEDWRKEKIAKFEKLASEKAKAKADEQSRIEAEILKLREAEKKADDEAKAKAVAEAQAAKAAAEAEKEAEKKTEEATTEAEVAPEVKSEKKEEAPTEEEKVVEETKVEAEPEVKKEEAKAEVKEETPKVEEVKAEEKVVEETKVEAEPEVKKEEAKTEVNEDTPKAEEKKEEKKGE